MRVRRESVRRDAAIWLSGLLVGLGSVIAGAQAPESGDHAVLHFSDLRLSLRSDRREYLLGQPVAVYAELRNPGDRPIQTHRRFAWMSSAGLRASMANFLFLSLEFSRDGKTFDTYHPYGAADVDFPPPPPAIIPAKTVLRTKALIVAADEPSVALQSPGEVELRAQFYNVTHREKVTSKSIALLLKSPQGKDAEALGWLRDHGLVKFLGYLTFLRGSFAHEHTHALRQFLERYPRSVYAPYAAFSLGQMYFYRERYPEAIKIFARVAETHPTSAVAEDSLYLAGETYRRLNNHGEADLRFRELIKRFPETPAADDAKEQLDQIAREFQMLFSGDRRLDAAIMFNVPGGTTVEDGLRVFSGASGVPLRVAPELRRMLLWRSPTQPVVLRHFMARLDRGRALWVRQEDGGYRLVPTKAPERTKLPEPPKPKGG